MESCWETSADCRPTILFLFHVFRDGSPYFSRKLISERHNPITDLGTGLLNCLSVNGAVALKSVAPVVRAIRHQGIVHRSFPRAAEIAYRTVASVCNTNATKMFPGLKQSDKHVGL